MWFKGLSDVFLTVFPVKSHSLDPLHAVKSKVETTTVTVTSWKGRTAILWTAEGDTTLQFMGGAN